MHLDRTPSTPPTPAADATATSTNATAAAAATPAAPADTLSPADRYQELFVDVQTDGVFRDSKTFVDCVPKGDPEQILAAYRAARSAADFDLAAFVHGHFDVQTIPSNHYVSDPDKSLPDHIDDLWPVLTRHPHEHPPYSSLLPLPHPYVVPGGRFGELYYWDSYFTMLGLAASDRRDLLHAMADNFAYLVDTYGRIPNGTRTYYLSRSQPPIFALMVELFESEGVRNAVHYLPQLRKEYDFWMDGADQLRAGEQHRRVVRLAGGELLNRYWDERETPREESFREDLATAAASERPAQQVYRDIRAAAESGWDFSSRWLAVENALHSIRTTSILPVDLNSFLYKLETTIADLSAATEGNRNNASGIAAEFRQKAAARKAAISRYMWNEESGAFFDFDWASERMRGNLTVATATPLFVQLASPAQAERVAATIAARLLKEGGIATTEVESGQQWDEPNGWASMQWLAIRGLEHYGGHALAAEIAHRWLNLVANLYTRESKLVEKYALYKSPAAPDVALGGGGGEYPLQDGFGWTNGVTRKLLQLYPQHAAVGCRAATAKAQAKDDATRK
ncbi:MAG TPA: alpha,alpha-trehalase TreF [Herbaspirillum sp.]|jgi:alpha,alpha-trehalase